MLVPDYLTSTIIYACQLSFLSFSFSLNHITDNFPNFIPAGIISTGIMLNYYASFHLNFSPYTGSVMAFLIGGLLGVITHELFRILKTRGRDNVQLTLASIGGMIVLTNLGKIWHEWLLNQYALYTVVLSLRHLDFIFLGNPGILFVSSFLFIVSVLFLETIPRYDSFAVFRAISGDKELAMIQGIDVTNIQRWFHFFTGGVSCLIGALSVINIHVSLDGAYFLLVAAIAGALFGGISSPRGSLLGGFVFGVFMVGLIRVGLWVFGYWVGEFGQVIPVLVLSLVLLFYPEGFLIKRGSG